MKKETILLITIALAVGTLAGVIYTNANKKNITADGQSASEAPSIDYQQNIKHLEHILAKEPDNHNAWVQLGHNYFDSNQPMKAIEAYDKALNIDGSDPDVLTDQGIMYRRVGWFGKAVENFEKANALNPRHIQSLYNLGIVYRDDLGDQIKAKEAWTKYLKIAPTGTASDKVRTMIDHMEYGH